jgi:enoyl-[acyl-carrier protein] reductase II
MAACFALGAEGVQVGTRFALSKESSAHISYIIACINAGEGDTILTLKNTTPVRMLKNELYNQISILDQNNADKEAYLQLMGKGRAKKGIFEGDLKEGELEIGQVTAAINQVKTAKEIIDEMTVEFKKTVSYIHTINF